MIKPALVPHLLEKSASVFPDKPALVHNGQSVSFGQLQTRVMACASFLAERRLPAGARIAILLDKSIEQVVALLGVLAAGHVFVLINPGLHEKQIKHIVTDCQVALLITAHKFDALVQPLGLGLVYAEDLPQEKNIPASIQKITDDIATIIYTSGSTGMPKGIVITHRNLIDGARIVSQYLHITPDDRLLGMLPFNFDYGLNQLLSALYIGCTIVLYQYFMPNGLLKILKDERITGLAAIPPIWAGVFNPKLCKLPVEQFPHLRYITNSGGKIPVPTVKKIRETFPATQLFLMYGLTEAFRSTYLDPAEVDRRPESMGKAIPNVQVEVINADGQACQPREIGELIHRGACIARGYWNNPEKTADVYKPNPLLPKENQFLETVVYSGDLVWKDEDGFLYFVGRKDNMIKTAGYRVSPTEVEELLLGCHGVAEAVVFGLPDDELGYKIRAVITVSAALEKQAIINHCKTNAPQYLVPHELFVREAFPKTASGKLDRPKIIEESKKDHGL